MHPRTGAARLPTENPKKKKKQMEKAGPSTNQQVVVLANNRHRGGKKPQQHWRMCECVCFVESTWIKEVIIYRGRNWKSRLSHDDSFRLESIWEKRPMPGGWAGGSGHGARGPIQWTRWGGDSGSRGATGPSGRRPLIGWPCRAREAPVACW